MAYDAKVNFVDVMFQVRMWDTIIYNYLKKRDIVIPLVTVQRNLRGMKAPCETTCPWCL